MIVFFLIKAYKVKKKLYWSTISVFFKHLLQIFIKILKYIRVKLQVHQDQERNEWWSPPHLLQVCRARLPGVLQHRPPHHDCPDVPHHLFQSNYYYYSLSRPVFQIRIVFNADTNHDIGLYMIKLIRFFLYESWYLKHFKHSYWIIKELLLRYLKFVYIFQIIYVIYQILDNIGNKYVGSVTYWLL